jgi:hypothetical protein
VLADGIVVYTSSFVYSQPPSVTSITPSVFPIERFHSIVITIIGSQLDVYHIDILLDGNPVDKINGTSSSILFCLASVFPSRSRARVQIIFAHGDGENFVRDVIAFTNFVPIVLSNSVLSVVHGYATTTLTFLVPETAIDEFTLSVNGSRVGIECEKISEVSFALRLRDFVPGHYQITVLSSSTQIAYATSFIEILGPVFIFKMLPIASTLVGGKLVTIFGSGFSNATELSCWFNGVTVPGVAISPSKLLCKTPPWTQPQLVNVSVNGRGSLSFEFLPPLSVQRVFPTVGLISTAFMVAIHADGLMESAMCKVHDVESECLLEQLGLCKCLFIAFSLSIHELYLDLYSESYFASGIELVEPCKIESFVPAIFTGHDEHIIVHVSGIFKQPQCVLA